MYLQSHCYHLSELSSYMSFPLRSVLQEHLSTPLLVPMCVSSRVSYNAHILVRVASPRCWFLHTVPLSTPAWEVSGAAGERCIVRNVCPATFQHLTFPGSSASQEYLKIIFLRWSVCFLGQLMAGSLRRWKRMCMSISIFTLYYLKFRISIVVVSLSCVIYFFTSVIKYFVLYFLTKRWLLFFFLFRVGLCQKSSLSYTFDIHTHTFIFFNLFTSCHERKSFKCVSNNIFLFVQERTKTNTGKNKQKQQKKTQEKETH